MTLRRSIFFLPLLPQTKKKGIFCLIFQWNFSLLGNNKNCSRMLTRKCLGINKRRWQSSDIRHLVSLQSLLFASVNKNLNYWIKVSVPSEKCILNCNGAFLHKTLRFKSNEENAELDPCVALLLIVGPSLIQPNKGKISAALEWCGLSI